jgi:hypothetical protein
MSGGRPTKDAGIVRTSAATYTALATTARTAVTPAPTTGQYLIVDDIVMSSDAALNVTFSREDANSTAVMKIYMPANGTVQITPRGMLKISTVTKKLNAKTSAAGNVSLTVFTHSEP